MSGRFRLLQDRIEEDLRAIEGIYASLERLEPQADTPEEALIATGYRLSNLYGAFENIFRNVAREFNEPPEQEQDWHRRLLQRMRMDLLPLRPAVIDEACFEKLDELRRFRHFFRAAYVATFKPERLSELRALAFDLRPLYRAPLMAFLAFVRELT